MIRIIYYHIHILIRCNKQSTFRCIFQTWCTHLRWGPLWWLPTWIVMWSRATRPEGRHCGARPKLVVDGCEILHHQPDGWEARNHGMFTIYELEILQPSTVKTIPAPIHCVFLMFCSGKCGKCGKWFVWIFLGVLAGVLHPDFQVQKCRGWF